MGSRNLPLVLSLVCALGSTLWSYWASNELSATFDEPVYLECGLKCWREHTHKPLMRLGTMPLPVDWVTFPIYAEDFLSEQPFELNRDFVEMLRIARTASLVFWWNLLFQAWSLGNRAGGHWTAFWMVAFVAWEPNLLGHSCLATTDIAVTGCLAGLINAYLRWKEAPNSKANWWMVVIWWGLSLFAKASTLAFAPLLLISVELGNCVNQWRQKTQTQEILSEFLGAIREQIRIGLWAFGLVFLLCGTDWQTETTFVSWAAGLEDGPLKSIMVPISENLKVFTNAGEGFAQQIKHNMRGHPSYLLGISHEKAVWYHFPVLFLIKLPTTFFLLLPLVFWQQWRKPWTWGIVASLVFLAFSINCRVQIGIRLLFPLVFLLTCLTAYSVSDFLRERSNFLRAVLTIGFLGLLISQSVRQFPDGIRYINDFWGRGESWDGLVSDSNYDWGQGLVELEQNHWVKEPFPLGVQVLYWGGADPRANIFPLKRLEPRNLNLSDDSKVREWLSGQKIAISATILHGPPLNSPQWEAFRRVLQLEKPIAKTRCFSLFDFRGR